MEKIVVNESNIRDVVSDVVNEIFSSSVNENTSDLRAKLDKLIIANQSMINRLYFIKSIVENPKDFDKPYIIGVINGAINDSIFEHGIAMKTGVVSETIDEALSYHEFKRGSKLEALRDAIERNQTISVVFVKKDGSVRPMAARKHFNYKFKSGEDFQPSGQGFGNHKDFYNVFDINVYIKIKRNTGDAEEAAKGAWRKIILGNVLGFLAGGRFYDLREENQIKERFGSEIYNQLTKSMARAAEKELADAKKAEENQNEQEDLPMDKSKTKGKKKIAKVMGEFSKGSLKTSYGTKVTDPKQAVAIAYSEAGLSKKKNESIDVTIRNEVQKLITESTKTKTMINRIYKAIYNSKLTSHSFSDDNWAGVFKLIELIRTVEGVLDVSFGAKDGGYRNNAEGTQWKEYQLEIDTIQGPVFGNLNAHAAGTVQDPFSRYDMTITLW